MLKTYVLIPLYVTRVTAFITCGKMFCNSDDTTYMLAVLQSTRKTQIIQHNALFNTIYFHSAGVSRMWTFWQP